MANPYTNLPDHAFWSRAVARLPADMVDPVTAPKFRIARTDKIATAGSCFAQHISRTLAAGGYDYLVTEEGPPEANYGVYPARFGNIYTCRQLLQLFERAYGLFVPEDVAWTRTDGALVDPFRPQVEPAGFPTLDALEVDRRIHMTAVRRMFETCTVFVFTLGLTEAWHSSRDGAVVPLAPGVVADPAVPEAFEFCNFSVAEMVADLTCTIERIRTVNPAVRVVLTVSPVPLIATYEPRHVLVSTIYSKSALRVVAEEVSRSLHDVDYFPSYEIVTGHHGGYGFFAKDLRSVTPAGVERVMSLFRRHYLEQGGAPDEVHAGASIERTSAAVPATERERELEALYQVMCDEEAIGS